MIVPMPPADLAPSAEPGAGLPLVRDLLAAYAEQPRVRSVAVVGNAPLAPDDGFGHANSVKLVRGGSSL